MAKFPEIMIIRHYELDGIEVTYSDDGGEKNYLKFGEKRGTYILL